MSHLVILVVVNRVADRGILQVCWKKIFFSRLPYAIAFLKRWLLVVWRKFLFVYSRLRPTRLGLVFYQHRDLDFASHGKEIHEERLKSGNYR